MRTSHKLWTFALLLFGTCVCGQGQVPATDIAQQQVTAYLSKLADLHCTESVVQEKLSGNGHVMASERSKFDYLIMMQGNGDDFQLIESRIESSSAQHKPLPMLVTNGFSSLLLIFHPYFRDSFQFESGGEDVIDGRPAMQVNFAHVTGKRTLAALALRGREYPLEFRGTAWLDKQSGEVVRIDANLLHEMSDVGLRTLKIHVEYKPTYMGNSQTSDTSSTCGRRFRNTEATLAQYTRIQRLQIIFSGSRAGPQCESAPG